uniref:energy-coupling factor transporter transmembrane component T n=1 Tax=Anaerobutyricum hallii TaxID=39488 RepID=UPI003FEEF7ED
MRTEEKIKTGNTEEKNHVDEIGSMVEGEVAKETVLPSWMCESEAYEPNIDKDGFITKSAQAILGVLAKLKWNAGKDRRFSASPSLKLCYTFLFILLTACSKNYLFSLIMVAGTILALASYPASAMKQILSGTIGAVLFSIFILLPAVFMGNPQILLTIGTKVFLSVTLIGMLSAGTAWNKLTASLRAFHIPDIFIFTLDITLKYIAVLGEICMEILTSLRLRSIGQNKKKAKAFSGILGISFLKSREMADEMYAAMCCRGFVGEYKTGRKYAFRKQDIFYIFSMIAVVGLFVYLEWKK